MLLHSASTFCGLRNCAGCGCALKLRSSNAITEVEMPPATGPLRDLAFADDFIDARVGDALSDVLVEDGIVVNLSPQPMVTGGDVTAVVPAWKSTWWRGAYIKSAERAAIVKVRRATNLGGVGLRGW